MPSLPRGDLLLTPHALRTNTLVGTSLTDMLNRQQLPEPAQPAGPSLPISPDGTLAVGVTYADQTDPARQWFLPSYSTAIADGRYTTSLKWRGPDDDPNGPLAYLTVKLTAGAPGPGLSEIPHTAVVQLVYDLSVAGDDAAGAATLRFDVGALNPDPDGSRSCRLPILTKPDFDRLYAAITNPAMHGRLEIHCAATLGQQVAHRTWIPGDFESPPIVPPWLEAVPQFVEVRRHFPQLVPQPDPPDDIIGMTQTVTIDTAPAFSVVAAEALVQPSETMTLQAAPTFSAAIERAVRSPGLAVARSAVARPFVTAVDQEQLGLPANTLRNRPFEPREPVDVPIERGPIFHPRPNWPSRGHWQTTTEVVQVAAAATQTIGFSFAVETNAYMFDIPDDLKPGTNEILLPYSVLVDGQLTTFYQDSVYRSRFYFAPQELRLTRDDEPPYLPKLLFTFVVADAPGSDGTATDTTDPGSGPTPPDYVVQVAFAAAPWISPLALEQMRQSAVAQGGIEFVPLAPLTAALTLSLPGPGGGATVATPQPAALISLDRGVSNQLTLSPEQFKAFVAAVSTAGIDGVVTTTLLGSTTKDVPLSLEFARTAGHLLSRQVTSGTVPGSYLVRLTNDIESAVTVHSARPSVLSPGVIATPAPFDAITISPHGSFDLTYQVQPAGTLVLDIDPDLDATVSVDASIVLPRLMLAQGYRTDTFTVPVSTDAVYFSTPGPTGATLTGLLVEFEAGVALALDATHLSGSVNLRMPWLPYVLNAPEAKQYRFRVTNVWAGNGSGVAEEPGSWQDGAGESALAITPNSAG